MGGEDGREQEKGRGKAFKAAKCAKKALERTLTRKDQFQQTKYQCPQQLRRKRLLLLSMLRLTTVKMCLL